MDCEDRLSGDVLMRAYVQVASAFALTVASACTPMKVGVNADGDPPKVVRAVAETVVTTDSRVDADDPALWANARDPSRAVMFGTDKSDGLYVHNLDGTVRQFLADGPLNNVDLREGFNVAGRAMVLVAASDRRDFGVRTYLLNPDTLSVSTFGLIRTDFGEPYGLCMGRIGSRFYVVVGNKDGDLLQMRVDAGGEGPVGTIERRLKVGTQPEGCVVDDETRTLYVGEEDVGIWKFDFDPNGSSEPTEVARVDNHRLTADVEGLALIQDQTGKYLVASSQGDSTFPVYRIENSKYVYLGRFAVGDGDAIDGVTETDGVAAWSGPIGPYAEGLLAMHDDRDDPNPDQQNYKLVDWRDVKRALGVK